MSFLVIKKRKEKKRREKREKRTEKKEKKERKERGKSGGGGFSLVSKFFIAVNCVYCNASILL